MIESDQDRRRIFDEYIERLKEKAERRAKEDDMEDDDGERRRRKRVSATAR